MKNICFFVTSLNSGGIENYLLRFLSFAKTEINATVFCIGNEFGDLEHLYRELPNIKLKKVRIDYLDVNAYYKLYLFLKKEKFHSICNFTGNLAGIVLWVAYIAGIETRVVFYRGSRNRFKETPFRMGFNKFNNILVTKYATNILSNSHAALNFFFKIKDERFKVIYNGIDKNTIEVNESKEHIRQELGIPITAYVIGHTGRVHFSKNHGTILKVANLLCSKYPQIHFILCGKNTDIELSQLIEPKLKKQIHLLGYRSDVARILKAFDVYFFPSITEGQPNALIEAMIAGLPIVSSNIDPIKETVPKEVVSLLIPPMNFELFYQRLEEGYLLKNNPLLISHKCWAIEKYNPEIQFKKFYKELIL